MRLKLDHSSQALIDIKKSKIVKRIEKTGNNNLSTFQLALN